MNRTPLERINHNTGMERQPSEQPPISSGQIALDSARNHMQRVKEGMELLGEGGDLTGMTTTVLEIGADRVRDSRQAYLDEVSGLRPDEINARLDQITKQIEKISKTDRGGTSELEWRRNVLNSSL